MISVFTRKKLKNETPVKVERIGLFGLRKRYEYKMSSVVEFNRASGANSTVKGVRVAGIIRGNA